MAVYLTGPGGIKGVLLMVSVFFFSYAWGDASNDGTSETKHINRQSPLMRVHSGPLEGFTLDKVYINDTGHRLSEDIRFYSRHGDEIPRDRLREGCRVKFVLNPDKEVVVIQVE